MKSKIIIFILAFCTLSAVTSCTDRKQQLINKLEKLSKNSIAKATTSLSRNGNKLLSNLSNSTRILPRTIKTTRLNNFMKLADSKAFALALLADIYHIP